jgi:hypothetical protein
VTTPQQPETDRPSTPSGSYTNGGGSIGRDVRLIVGALLVFIDLGLLYLEHVHAIPPAAYSTPDIILHLGMLVGGLFLMDPRRTLELIGIVKDKLPVVGK